MSSLNSTKEKILNDLHSAEGRCNSSEIKDLETELEILQTKNKLKETIDNTEKIIKTTRDKIPPKAIKKFEGYSKRFILPKQYKEDNFEAYACMNHALPEPYTTYLAIQEKHISKECVEKNIYIFEQDSQGRKIGHGEIRLAVKYKKEEEAFFKDKPFVGYTATEEEFQNKGYGTARIKHMNEISQFFLGNKLYSGTLFSQDNAKKIWEKLEQEGLAKRYQEDDADRFYFI